MKTGWVISMVLSAWGLLNAVMIASQAKAIPAQIYGLEYAIAFSVVPYCIMRMIEALAKKEGKKE